jgi:spore germination protein
MVIHTVAPGDTIYTIAQQYGVQPARIISDNMLTDPANLVVGQTLVILYYNQVHIVRPGDTLFTIASAYGTTAKALLRNNPQLRGNLTIFEGQPIVIDYNSVIRGKLTTNGYAYPFIDSEVLRMTLPFLTYLTIFTYGFTPTGGLVVPDDEELIALAREYNVAPMMMLSTLTEEGRFSNELSTMLLTNPSLQTTLIENIINNLNAKGYYGLEIDFEYVRPEERDAYTTFIRRVTEAANAAGFPVGVALAPKTSADQPGLLYEAHDYGGIGSVADFVLLMTYEWGYTYSPPMAVAPINMVTAVVDYALTEIPADKINMGVPNYGYVWPLPFIEGESRARSISNVEAVDIARRYNAEIMFDPVAMSPFYTYRSEDGQRHEVWFEDARSIEAKLNLATQKSLRGVAIWNIMRFFPQLWLVANGAWIIEDLPV